MSFMQLKGSNELKEPTLAPEAEYSLQVTDVDPYTKDTGRDIIKLRIDFQDHDDYQSFNHWIALPNWKLDVEDHPEGSEAGQKKFNMMAMGCKRMCAQWGVPFDDGFEPTDFQGAVAVAKVTQEERNGMPGTWDQRLLTPRLQG